MPWKLLLSARVSATSDTCGAVAVPAFGLWPTPRPSVTKTCTGYRFLRSLLRRPPLPIDDVDFGPQWEFNFGVGVGTMRSTDHLNRPMHCRRALFLASPPGRETENVTGLKVPVA